MVSGWFVQVRARTGGLGNGAKTSKTRAHFIDWCKPQKGFFRPRNWVQSERVQNCCAREIPNMCQFKCVGVRTLYVLYTRQTYVIQRLRNREYHVRKWKGKRCCTNVLRGVQYVNSFNCCCFSLCTLSPFVERNKELGRALFSLRAWQGLEVSELFGIAGSYMKTLWRT